MESDEDALSSGDEEPVFDDPTVLAPTSFTDADLVPTTSFESIISRSPPFARPGERVELPTLSLSQASHEWDIDAIEVLLPVTEAVSRIGNCGALVFSIPRR